MSKYDDLVKKLKEIFQIDRPELDFGIYRIFNARAAEINHYLEHRLKAKVSESLAASGAANLDGLQRELAEKEAQYRADGIDPAAVPKIQEIKQKLAQYSTGTSEHENAVFSHLLTFFSRYYDKGDFISQRRYKGDTYAIPYAGEEVMLHWANKDQYYIKSSESFSNYAFKLDDGRTVSFRLVAADTAKDNRKDNDKERRFVLIEPHTRILTDGEGEEYEEELLPVTEEIGANGQELVLRFEYKAMPKGSPEAKQEKLVADAVNTILNDANVKARWLDLSQRAPTEKKPAAHAAGKTPDAIHHEKYRRLFHSQGFRPVPAQRARFLYQERSHALGRCAACREICRHRKEPAPDSNPARHRAGFNRLPRATGRFPEKTLAQKEVCCGDALLHHARPGAGKHVSHHCRQCQAMGAVGKAGNAG